MDFVCRKPFKIEIHSIYLLYFLFFLFYNIKFFLNEFYSPVAAYAFHFRGGLRRLWESIATPQEIATHGLETPELDNTGCRLVCVTKGSHVIRNRVLKVRNASPCNRTFWCKWEKFVIAAEAEQMPEPKAGPLWCWETAILNAHVHQTTFF